MTPGNGSFGFQIVHWLGQPIAQMIVLDKILDALVLGFPKFVHSALRYSDDPESQLAATGFRIARTLRTSPTEDTDTPDE
jgi:hypothetical protein